MKSREWPPTNSNDNYPPHVIIIGGGFGGLNVAKGLRNSPVNITLIDKSNHHLFQPLLYQVATASLSPSHIAMPVRAILRTQKNIRVLMNRVSEIIPEKKSIRLTTGDLFTYDYLVIATGARHSYFGHPEWEARAPGLKSLADALKIRQRILASFERAEAMLAIGRENKSELRKLLTFVIVGGGPTGVELAGAIAEIAYRTLRKEFRNIDLAETRVILLEGGANLLGAYPEVLSENARRELEKLGVSVMLRSQVSDIMFDGVLVKSMNTADSNEAMISTYNVFWAAGNEASPLLKTIQTEQDNSGRILVEPDLSVKKYPEISVIGDAAHFKDQFSGKPLPGVAPVAVQQGRYLAQRLTAQVRKKKTNPFRYTDKGSMATVGRGRAVVHLAGLHLTGFTAWLLWSFVHILYLIGFRNRFGVMALWIYSYLTNRRAVRLITADDDR